MVDRLDAALENLRRLRNLESSYPELSATLEPVAEQLYQLTGATVSRSTAARLLGVSQPALDRWVGRGEIPVVWSPTGRRSVPVGHLLDLLEEVEQARSRGLKRPLQSVIKERRTHAESVTLEGILDADELRTCQEHGHRRAELLSLGFHRIVAQRLDEHMIRQARRRVRLWQSQGKLPPKRGEVWGAVLDSPTEEIAAVISADTEEARDLRQSTPFAGALTGHERMRLIQLLRGATPQELSPAR